MQPRPCRSDGGPGASPDAPGSSRGPAGAERDGRPSRVHRALLGCAVVCLCLLGAAPTPAATFSAWRQRQDIALPGPGLIRLELPAETLDAARADLADLRIQDPQGGEVPFLLDRGAPTPGVSRDAKSLRVALDAASTVLIVETGTTAALDGVTLSTPSEGFIKAARVAGSADGATWRVLAERLPIFRQPNGVQLHLPFPEGAWRFLRVTVDDRRSPPVPFTGARVRVAALDPVASVPVEVRTAGRVESPGETQITLQLGFAHLHLSALQIESPEPVFSRRVSLTARQVEGDAIHETRLAEALISRDVRPEGVPQDPVKISLDVTTPSRELFLRVRNEDSPPLPISAVRAERRPVHVLFVAREDGPYRLLAGNRRAAAPRYDLDHVRFDVSRAVRPLGVTPLAANPEYRAPDVVPSSAATGPALDVSAWPYRKPVRTAGTGMHQLELDLDVLSRTVSTHADLRLLSHGQQLPYILERTSVPRTLSTAVAAAGEPRRPKLSRWALKLTHGGLPLTRLACTTATPLFRRDMRLYEEALDARGGKFRRELGHATWVQTPERPVKELLLALSTEPTTDTLLLETHDGDNPPITLEACRASYFVRRVHFQAAADTHLYYGNRRAEPPRYDLSLVAHQVLTADATVASLDAEEQVGGSGWPTPLARMWRGGILLWGALAVVVVTLLVVISRLLPKPAPPGG
jgi:hypothetical protein